MDQEKIDKILSENLKLMRSFIFLKRQVILLTAEKDDREKTVKDLERKFMSIEGKFYSLQQSYNNIKEMQNDIAYQNSIMVNKFKRLEDIVLAIQEINKNNENTSN